jgi:hypothetical protein
MVVPEMRHFKWALIFSALGGLSALAQPGIGLSPNRWQLGLYAGPSIYAGDLEAEVLDRGFYGFGFGVELFRELSRIASIGMRATTFSHPRLVESDQFRSTLEAVFRLAPARFSGVSPYLEIGVHHLVGTGRGGSGPVFGAGLSLRIAKNAALFGSAAINMVHPGDVLDLSTDPDHFDVLLQTRFGLRISFLDGMFRKRNKIRIASIAYNRRPTPLQPIRFAVSLVEPNSGYQYFWSFSDGGTGVGNPVQHAFLKSGIYEANVRIVDRDSETTHGFVIEVGNVARRLQIGQLSDVEEPQSWIDLSDIHIFQPDSVLLASEEVENLSEATEPVETDADTIPNPVSGFSWIVGSTRELDEARYIARRFSGEEFETHILAETLPGGIRYRVALGIFPSANAAAQARSRLPDSVPEDSWILFIGGQERVTPNTGPDTRSER